LKKKVRQFKFIV